MADTGYHIVRRSMAKSEKQKLKLLYIIKILQEQSDENHPVSTQKLIQELEKQEILAERKSIYNDIAVLIDFGYDIVTVKSRTNGGYYLGNREFELAELKLLVDAVVASKFITLKKSTALIQKLESFVSNYDGKQLQRQVYVKNRIKTSNESIYYNIDYIHKALQNNKKIEFQYSEWNVSKKTSFKNEGKKYKVSPWALSWNDENYYLIAFDENSGIIKHYRVDKMAAICVTEEGREGLEFFQKTDIAEYENKTFGMFGGVEQMVSIQFENQLIGVVIDRFGKEIDIRKRDENYFSIRIKVAVSNQFFGWLTGLGTGTKILSPVSVIENYRQYLEKISLQYIQNKEEKFDSESD